MITSGSAALDPSDVETVKAKLGIWFTRLQEFEGVSYKDFKDRVNIVVTDLLFPPPEPEMDRAAACLPVAFLVSEDAEWITHDEAASLLGVSTKRLSVYIRQGNMPYRHALDSNGRQVFAVPRQLILDLAAHGSRFATAKQAREYLGVHKTQFGHLLEAKVLAERDSATRPVLMHTSKFTWDDLAGLVRRIRSNAIAADDETVAFSELTLQRTTDRSAILSLLSSIGRAEISSVECSAELTLGQVRFLKTDIDAFLGQYQTSLTLSANELAQLTGWKNECVAAWCSQGLLKSATVKAGGAPRYSIRNEHLVQFTNEYVPLATLAHHAGTTPRGLLRQLEARGIRTSGSFPVADTTRGHLVRIVDLLPTAS